MQDYAAENTATSTDPIYILSKEESASIADKVYNVLQDDWASGQTGLTEEQIANLQSNVYSAVYEELQDKASTDVINNVYDNIMAICLNDIYRYDDNKDAVVKQALEAQLAKLSTGLIDVDAKLTTAQNDYATLTQALSDSYYDQGYQVASEDFANTPYHVEYVGQRIVFYISSVLITLVVVRTGV